MTAGERTHACTHECHDALVQELELERERNCNWRQGSMAAHALWSALYFAPTPRAERNIITVVACRHCLGRVRVFVEER